MSNELDKDVLEHLCATDPLWASALQIVQTARTGSNGNDAVLTSAKLVCAIVLLASDMPRPQEFLKFCAESLLRTPMKEAG